MDLLLYFSVKIWEGLQVYSQQVVLDTLVTYPVLEDGGSIDGWMKNTMVIAYLYLVGCRIITYLLHNFFICLSIHFSFNAGTWMYRNGCIFSRDIDEFMPSYVLTNFQMTKVDRVGESKVARRKAGRNKKKRGLRCSAVRCAGMMGCFKKLLLGTLGTPSAAKGERASCQDFFCRLDIRKKSHYFFK